MNPATPTPPRERSPLRYLGGPAAARWLGLGIVMAVLFYGAGRMLLLEPTPSPLPSPRESPEPAATANPARVIAALGLPGESPDTRQPVPAREESQQRAALGSPPPLRSEELLDELMAIKQAYAHAPTENDLAIRRILRQLAALGLDALPAIQDFLATGEDLAFELVSADGRILDATSLRLAMLEMLSTLRAPEATDILVDELLGTGSPQEIQAIAGFLEKQYPGEYLKLAIDTTYDVLGRMARGEMEGGDAAPLFHLLAEYGDAEAIAQLEKSDGSWPLYRAVALAEAPDGTGVPGLIRVWQQGGDPSRQQITTQLLAQSAARYPEAAEALVEGLGSNKIPIPDHLWPKIGQALTGKYELGLIKPDVGPLPAEVTLNPYRNMVVGGGQGGSSTIYITDVKGMSAEERRARLAVVERILDQNLGPAANQAMEQARSTLER